MGDSNKRIAIIGVSTFLLVAMVVAVTVSIGNNKNEAVENSKDTHVSASVKAVKTLCAPTDYKKECEESLTQNAGNITDPRELIKIAFNVTITKIGEGLEKTQLLQEVEKDPRTKEALDTCKDLMHLSTEEFKRSLERFGNFNLNSLDRVLTSLKVWLSGAITYQETCLDAFENTTTDAGHKMQEILKTAMHMSSNGLSIINELSKTFADMKPAGRRLLKENVDGGVDVFGNGGNFELPEWVENRPGVRKLLKMTGRKLSAHVVVAKDGTGNFTTINEALKTVPHKNLRPYVIYIKEGIYNEYVEVARNMTHVVFIGDGGRKSRITGNKNFIDGVGTYRTATVGKYICLILF
jgi:pectinesterase